MRQIGMGDIRKRLDNLNKIKESCTIINQVYECKQPKDIKRMVENLVKSNHNVTFNVYLELFDNYCEIENERNIRTLGLYIANEAVCKTRDAKNTLALLRGRLTRLQNKLDPSKKKTKKSKIIHVKEAYENMINKCIIVENCDRVIDNYNNISKRFNLEILFNENTRKYGVYDTVIQLCNKIDTYKMPDDVKFNSIIETALYGFESNYIDYKKSDIIEAAVDYFMFKANGITVCKNILESTLFFDKHDDVTNVEVLMEDEPESEEETPKFNDNSIRVFFNGEETLSLAESYNFKELFDKYKAEELIDDEHPENKLKMLISKLYAPNVENVVEGTDSLLRWIRTFFIIGAAAIPFIGPVLMAVEFVADRFISLKFERDESLKMYNCFNKEIKTTKDKIKECTDPEEKDRLTQYSKALEKASEKIHSYMSDRFSEKDMEDLPTSGYSDDDFDFDFDLDDLDDLLETTVCIDNIYDNFNNLINASIETKLSRHSLYETVLQMDNDSIITIAKIANKVPNYIYKDVVNEAIDNMLNKIRNNTVSFNSKLDRYNRVSTLQTAKSILENNDIFEIKSLKDMNRVTESVVDIYTGIGYINADKSSFMEASFLNNLKLASMKLKQGYEKLSDKEKSISKTLDYNVNKIADSLKTAVRNDSRESIIKGSVLPSASKVIKFGIINAGLGIAIDPAIAVITTLGYIGINRAYRNKERLAVLDELEVELQMCDKYIEVAEGKNDMVALKQLLQTKKALQRQIVRINHNIKTDSNK